MLNFNAWNQYHRLSKFQVHQWSHTKQICKDIKGVVNLDTLSWKWFFGFVVERTCCFFVCRTSAVLRRFILYLWLIKTIQFRNILPFMRFKRFFATICHLYNQNSLNDSSKDLTSPREDMYFYSRQVNYIGHLPFQKNVSLQQTRSCLSTGVGSWDILL